MSTIATDAFTRANSTGLGANWTQVEGTTNNTINVSTNQAVNANDNFDTSYNYNNATWPNDQYSQANITTSKNEVAQDGPAVAVRVAAAAVTYYRMVFSTGASGGFSVSKKVTGSYTLLGTTGGAPTNGDLVRIEAQGTTIRAVQNGSTLSGGTFTDSSIASGRAGLSFSSDGNAVAATWDNWEGGDFSAGTQDTPELYGRPYGVLGGRVMQQLLAT